MSEEIRDFLSPLPSDVASYILRVAKFQACHQGRCGQITKEDLVRVVRGLKLRVEMALETVTLTESS